MDQYFRLFSYLFLACWWLWLESNRTLSAYLRFNRQQFAVVRLYWQRPTATPETNKGLYWFLMLPTLIYGVGFILSLSVAPSINAYKKWLEFDFLLFCIAFYNLIYIPKTLIVSPDGIFWDRLYPWETILHVTWKSNANGIYFCFTPKPGKEQPAKEQPNKVIYVGPMTERDHWHLETALTGLQNEQSVSRDEEAGG
jgi:hypothetical protein